MTCAHAGLGGPTLQYRITDANDATAARTDDLRAALIGHTIFEASASLALLARDLALPALEGEAEHWAATDPAAAAQALASLRQLHGCLERALADARMGEMLAAALTRAADALPDESGRAA